MYWLITKFLLSAGIIVLISEVAKRSDKLGALIGALPAVTILALIWMHIEGQPTEKLSNHAFLTFWYVLPSLPMFLVFPYLLGRLSFGLSLLTGILLSAICFGIVVRIAKLFGVELL